MQINKKTLLRNQNGGIYNGNYYFGRVYAKIYFAENYKLKGTSGLDFKILSQIYHPIFICKILPDYPFNKFGLKKHM